MMYFYLKIISGERAGETVRLNNGQHLIGRAPECQIVIDNKGISKKHARITVADRNVIVEDLGSSNGTFVNGIFATKKSLSVGDRIVLPGVVFSLNMGVEALQGNLQATGSFGAIAQQEPISVPSVGNYKEKSIKQSLQEWFLKSIQPVLDRILLKYEWKQIILACLFIFGCCVTLISSIRFVSVNHNAIRNELTRRGLLLAERVAEVNLPHVQNRDDYRLETERFEKYASVESVFVTSPDGKIIAPTRLRDSYIPINEGLTAARTEKGASIPVVVNGSVTSVFVSHPIPRFDAAKKVNVVGAMAVVKLNVGPEELHWSESMNIIVTTLVSVLILVGLFYLIIYRLTAQPFQDMNDEIEQVLKGSRTELRSPVRFLELESLVRSFNFLLNKINNERRVSPKSSQSSVHQHLDLGSDPTFQFVVENSTAPMVVINGQQRVALISRTAHTELLFPEDSLGRAIVEACEDQVLLGAILEGDREAKNRNGIPYETQFSVFGRNYKLRAIAGFDELGEHMRTTFIFEVENG